MPHQSSTYTQLPLVLRKSRKGCPNKTTTKVAQVCLHCGSEFLVYRCRVAQDRVPEFCNKVCQRDYLLARKFDESAILPENRKCCIPLTRGLVAWVDPDDFDRVSQYQWNASRGGRGWYAYHRFFTAPNTSHLVSMHRFIFGDVPPGIEVDHRDGDTLNNRRSNLRAATKAQQQQNRGTHKQPGDTSRFKGVYWAYGAWCVQIRLPDGSRPWVGRFTDEIDAAHAYDQAARDAFGEYARLNFPTEPAVPQPT